MSLPLEDERLFRIARRAPIGFFEADAHGTLAFASARWFEIVGRTADEAIGHPWTALAAPEDRERLENAWLHAVARGEEFTQTHRVVHGAGRRTVYTSIRPAGEPKPDALAFAGVTVEISDQIDEGGEPFRLLSDVIPQLMWIAAPDGTMEYFNRPWLDYTGITLEAVRTEGVKNVVHPDELHATWANWNRALATGEPYEIEYRLRSAQTGTYRWFIGRAVPYRDSDGQVVRWIGTATDIDAQKRANDNLRFVLDASNALAEKRDSQAICSAFADLAIHGVADWCFIVLKDGARAYRTAAMAHRDPQRVRLIERFRDRYPLRAGSPLDRAIRRNAPMLIPHVDDGDLRAAAEDEQHLEILRSLRMESAMLLPLSAANGEVFGGIMLVSSESARRYTSGDLEVAEMVAHRAGAALATAAAFAHEQRRTRHLHFIAQAGELLARSTDLQSMLDRLVHYVVSDMADFAVIVLAERRDALRTVACAHADPEKAGIADQLRGQRMLRPEAEERMVRTLSQHRTVLRETVEPEVVRSSMWAYLASAADALDARSAITVPLFARGETFGALMVYRCGGERTYAQEDADAFTDLGRRISIAIDHQQTLERERRIAEALQQALLPQPGGLPSEPRLQFAAHYRPSTNESHVGGDWYDAVALPDGSVLVSIGDVTGRGLEAAGQMGKLRQALGMAALYEPDPARMLDAVDSHMRSRKTGSIATAFVGVIDPQRANMRYAGAGHPPPLLRRGGAIEELHSHGLPLGLRDEYREQTQTVTLDGADLLVLYTDGITEATRDVAFGEQRLESLVSSEAISFVRNPAEFLCDACLPLAAGDDTAVLTVSFGERPSWKFDVENAQAAHEARSELVAHLRERAPDCDAAAAEVVFAELIGNVVRHAPGPIEVQLEWTRARPVLHVIDRGRGFLRDPGLPVDILSESGRGLYIVEQLTRALRVERIAGYGNHVAAELRL